MNPPAHTTIRTWVETFINLGNCKTQQVFGVPLSPSRRCKQSVLFPATPNKVPGESSFRFTNSLLHHTEHPKTDTLHVSVQDNKITTLLKPQGFFLFNKLRSLNCLWTKCRPVPVSHLGPTYLTNVYSRLKVSEHSRHSYLRTENPREIQRHGAQCENVTVWCALHANDLVDPY